MVLYREQLGYRGKGSMAEREDWYTLVYDSAAREFFVERSWDHVNLNNLAAGNSQGVARFSAEDWSGEGAEKIPEARQRLLALAGH